MLKLLVEREVRGLAEGLGAGIFGEATVELLGSFNLSRRTQRCFEHALDLRFDEEMPNELHAFLDHNRLLECGMRAKPRRRRCGRSGTRGCRGLPG